MKTIEQIAAELQGYDPQAISAERVNDFLARLVEPVSETETLGVFDALGRVLAADVVSPISVPPHDNSAMDGFAFDGALLRAGEPLTLQLAEGTAFAGTLTGSPVRGLRPFRASRLRTENAPKPRNSTRSPRARASPISPRMTFTTFSTSS